MTDGVEQREGGQAHVLIVEDEAGIAAMLSLMLELEGYTAHVARTGRAALDFLCPGWDRAGSMNGVNGRHLNTPHRAPSLILLDLHLGDMEGVDVIHCLKERGYRVPPVILLSARQHEAVLAAAREVGAAAYFVKPLELDHLILSVQKVLS
jgi:DNA-binding response OmpR family regulator